MSSPAPTTAFAGLPTRRLAPWSAAAIALVLGVVALNAWVCDDAYITMRTAETFLRGGGLTWNPGERVQTYTHPLWLFALVVGRALTGDAYFAFLGLSIATTAATLVAVSAVGSHSRRSAWIVAAFALSPSFVQFATSGLENPATHVLLVLFAAAYLRRTRLVVLVAIGSVLALNRADAILLVAPAIAIEMERERRRSGAGAVLRALVIGGAPLALWELFSLLYYGSLVPNTAHAKLAHGLPRSELAVQGLHYLATFASFDPVGAVLTLTGLAVGLASWRVSPRRAALAAGGRASVGDVVSIGGDFMAGRMLTPPLVVAVLGLVTARVRALEARAPIPQLAAIALVLAAALPERHVLAVLSESLHVAIPAGPLPLYSRHWVGDEQRYYRGATGLLGWRSDGDGPPWHQWHALGRAWRAQGGVHEFRNIGFTGWAAQDRAHIVDAYALSEPMLARLPAFRNPDWHVGHYQRTVPRGYVRSIRSGTCEMEREELCELFRDLQLVTRGPLFSAERLAAIIRLSRFRASEELAFEMRHPDLARVETPLARPVGFGDSGVQVSLPEPRAGEVRVELGACVTHELRFLRGGEQIHVERQRARGEGDVCVIEAASSELYDGIWVLPVARPGPYDLRSLETR